VYYLLGEEFDRDPFLLFKLRGLTREELLERLSAAPTPTRPQGRARAKVGAAPPAAVPEAVSSPPPEPLPSAAGSFWGGDPLPDDLFGEVQLPPVAAALPRRLGNFPFWRGTERLLDTLEPVYRQAGTHGLNVFLGESTDH
jgi:uncharacterized Zn finger protein